MLGHRTLTPEDYLVILRKRWWIVVVPALLLSAIATGVSYFVPPVYTSQTLVLVEQQKVPDNYVKPIIAEDLNSRLASMQEQILSRSRLQPIIERFNLYGNKRMTMDDRIDKVRKDITIRPIESPIARAGGLPGFFILFQASDARTAQLACGEIESLFVSENLKSREQSAEGTTEFLRSQLDEAKRNLDQQDSRLADFQRAYAGKMPEQEGANMNMMTTLNTQLDASTQALNRLEQDRSYEEAMLSQMTKELPVAASPAEQPRMSTQAQQAELQQLLSTEADLTARYTDDYPDVVTVRRKIRELRQQMANPPAAPAAAATSAPSVARPEPPGVQQLRAQLRALDQAIVSKKQEQSGIQSQLRTYQDRISSSPIVQEQLKTLTRDYQTAQTFYDELLTKMNQSKMATDLERRQQGEQFRVMDEPNLPDSPTFPKRGVFLAGGLVAGLALGLLIVAWMEYRNTALRNERDIWSFTKLPTLAVISFSEVIVQPPVKRRMGPGRHKEEPSANEKPLMSAGA